MANQTLTIKYNKYTDLLIGYFDNDKELEFSVEIDTESHQVYLTANYVNDIVTHLIEQLISIGEPVKVLEDYKKKIDESNNY